MNRDELGFGTAFENYRKLTVDNGTDTSGTGATGAYITKNFRDGQTVRDLFAPEFEGVILLSRARLVEKGKTVTWRTAEFNPIKTGAKIPVLAIAEGKPIKDNNGNYKVTFQTLEEIKSKMSYTTPKGVERTYNYLVVLYILVKDSNEVVKLEFKGTGRQNFFEYTNQLQRANISPWEVFTKFSTNIDKYNKYVVVLTRAEGTPDPNAVLQHQEAIINSGSRINQLYTKSYNKLLESGVDPDNVLPESEDISEDEIPFEG